MTEIALSDCTVRLGGQTRLDGVSLRLGPGELVVLLGPNGAGKTTLVRAVLGLQPLDAGGALIDGKAADRLGPAQRARCVSYLPQIRPMAWPNPVRDVVSLGRFAHGARLGSLAEGDGSAVDRAIAACQLAELADRPCDQLSGGELARVHFARAFAAEAPILIADEPLASLDPPNQLRVMGLVRDFVAAGGGALVVMHDIQMALRFADRLLWMRQGRLVADAGPDPASLPSLIQEVYDLKANLVDGPSGPVVSF